MEIIKAETMHNDFSSNNWKEKKKGKTVECI